MPPRKKPDKYARFFKTRMCRYSAMECPHRRCLFAHSPEELRPWRVGSNEFIRHGRYINNNKQKTFWPNKTFCCGTKSFQCWDKFDNISAASPPGEYGYLGGHGSWEDLQRSRSQVVGPQNFFPPHGGYLPEGEGLKYMERPYMKPHINAVAADGLVGVRLLSEPCIREFSANEYPTYAPDCGEEGEESSVWDYYHLLYKQNAIPQAVMITPPTATPWGSDEVAMVSEMTMRVRDPKTGRMGKIVWEGNVVDNVVGFPDAYCFERMRRLSALERSQPPKEEMTRHVTVGGPPVSPYLPTKDDMYRCRRQDSYDISNAVLLGPNNECGIVDMTERWNEGLGKEMYMRAGKVDRYEQSIRKGLDWPPAPPPNPPPPGFEQQIR